MAGHSDAERNADIVPYRVIADHIRAAVFLISDGVLPGAKGRAAIPRIVIRRAVRFGSQIGFDEPFLADVADAVIETMGAHYSDIVDAADSIKRAITLEEERFHRTMERGLNELEAMLSRLQPQATLPGADAFYLKATLGLPFQVTRDIVEERGYRVDEPGFAAAEAEHSRISGGKVLGEIDAGESYRALLSQLEADGQLGAEGIGYQPYDAAPLSTTVLALMQDGQRVERAALGERVEVVLAETNFYVEAGGQVSDRGSISGDGWLIEIEAMKQPVAGLVAHVGEVVEGAPGVGDGATAMIDAERRARVVRNHTATHLLHAALRDQLGTHVQQKGSLVAPDRLRFDFSHPERVADAELAQISKAINKAILADHGVQAQHKPLDEARREGAMALFGEKYDDIVRAVIIGDARDKVSYELCGGVHVARTAQIGSFVFTAEGSVSAGIRRVEALTGDAAIAFAQAKMALVDDAAARLGVESSALPSRIDGMQGELAAARREIETLRRRLAKHEFDDLLSSRMEALNGAQCLLARLDSVPMDTMRQMNDWFRQRVDKGVMVLASDVNGRPQILVAVTDALVKDGMRAGDLIKPIAAVVGGGGGGRPQMAQAGGRDSGKIDAALQKARQLLMDAGAS